MDALRVGLVGLGVVAQVVYLPLLARRRDMFRVAAVCDLDLGHAEEVGGEIGARAYGDPVEMLDGDGFDAVLVLTPGCHGGLVRATLERGHWVLCEKPLAYSHAEVRGLTEHGARLMVGYMKQYDPAVQRLLECLHEAGGPECVRHLDVTVLHPSGESQRLFARPRASGHAPERLAPYLEAEERSITAALGTAPDRVRRLYSQVLLGSISHELSLIRLFTEPSPGPSTGPPAGSSARSSPGSSFRPDTETVPTVDHVAVWPLDAFPPSVEVAGVLPGPPAGSSAGSRSGRFGLRWHYLPSYPAYHETVTLHHEHGSLELHFPSPYLLNAPTRLTVRSRVGTTERTMVFRDVAEAFERQLVAFHRFVTQGEPPLTGLDGALRDIVTAQLIARKYAESVGIPLGGESAEISPDGISPGGISPGGERTAGRR
ncbi:Gfo/Idh/MocA family protein [Sphaerimonospora cavernae]|uniref:Gfo/Idh/MocA family protein n=1 Tax=Sphaerimonospora cavernae TaxID=1740611 RepID=A0ABV6U5M1_9ACTN